MHRLLAAVIFIVLALQLGAPAFAAHHEEETTRQAAAKIVTSAAQHYFPVLGEDLPNWAKRIEFDFSYDGIDDPTFSLLTVQPLYQDDAKTNTVFVQGSQLRYGLLDEVRDTTNFGLGYRRLFWDGSVMLGINGFFDHEWTFGHNRASFGGEAKWGALDFTANRYIGLDGTKAASAGTSERALSGHDYELRTQVPYLSWLRVGARGYFWDTQNIPDIEGWETSFDADLSPNASLEVGASDDNTQASVRGFMRLTLRAARTNRPSLIQDGVGKAAFADRDLRHYTLDKVRRENRILVERSGAGVVIARGN